MKLNAIMAQNDSLPKGPDFDYSNLSASEQFSNEFALKYIFISG